MDSKDAAINNRCADFDAVERTLQVIKHSTFKGDSVEAVATTLGILVALKREILRELETLTESNSNEEK